MRWQEHAPSPLKVVGPDFKTMNKLAAMRSVCSLGRSRCCGQPGRSLLSSRRRTRLQVAMQPRPPTAHHWTPPTPCSGVTSPKEVAAFRQTHSVMIKKGEPRAPAAQLPSDADPGFAYGMPSSHRSAESVRNNGPEEPKMKHLVQVRLRPRLRLRLRLRLRCQQLGGASACAWWEGTGACAHGRSAAHLPAPAP